LLLTSVLTSTTSRRGDTLTTFLWLAVLLR
jgi:hypothetical protein